MSKSNKEQAPKSGTPTVKLYSYSVSRFESGYYVIRHTIEENKVVESIKVTEPDILTICMANLERIIRKENGL